MPSPSDPLLALAGHRLVLVLDAVICVLTALVVSRSEAGDIGGVDRRLTHAGG